MQSPKLVPTNTTFRFYSEKETVPRLSLTQYINPTTLEWCLEENEVEQEDFAKTNGFSEGIEALLSDNDYDDPEAVQSMVDEDNELRKEGYY